MMLNFLGNGAGFSEEHTSAYFVSEENDFVLLDCSTTAFTKLMKLDLYTYRNIYVLITHTHGDHVGGLGIFAQYCYFVLNRPLIIVAPTYAVRVDIANLMKIFGVQNQCYQLIIGSYDLKKVNWFKNCILTKHDTNLLISKCFGYSLNVNGTHCVYTGDTSILEPFYSYLKPGSELYVDISVHYGIVHLKLDEILPELTDLASNGVKIFLMHIDDLEGAKKQILNIPNIEIAYVKKNTLYELNSNVDEIFM